MSEYKGQQKHLQNLSVDVLSSVLVLETGSLTALTEFIFGVGQAAVRTS